MPYKAKYLLNSNVIKERAKWNCCYLWLYSHPQDLAFLKVQFISPFFVLGCIEPIVFDTGANWCYCLCSRWMEKPPKQAASPTMMALQTQHNALFHSISHCHRPSLTARKSRALTEASHFPPKCLIYTILYERQILSCWINLSTFAQRCCTSRLLFY